MAEEYAADFEARQAMMGLIVRVIDEMRFGVREVDVDQLQTLAYAWTQLNDGETPSEVGLRLMKDRD